MFFARLENLKDEMWGEQVEVICQDMRDWEAPEKADILVSELLGSFGDNELSPECLDGAQRFLKGNPFPTFYHNCTISQRQRSLFLYCLHFF